jgi:ATP-dependent RNA helicase RhlE
MTFQDLKLIEPIRRALKAEGYVNPTPVQQQAIPFALKGRDLLACAQTGTGKTAAFAVPILQQLYESKQGGPRPIRALVITPTRELAIQIGESFAAYGCYTSLRHTVIFGGVSQNRQVKALRNGVDILVATPGRLLDLMNQGYISLKAIEHFVLDEADRMLDMGFIHDIRRILRKLPARRQTLFFSATMPGSIQELADSILTNPKKVEVTPASTTAEKVSQYVYHVVKSDKRRLLIHLLREENIDSALVFTRTKHGANRVAQQLTRAGIQAQAIHGNKSQTARQQALNRFKNKLTRVLVATDIAARGIDVDELSHVINFDLPNVPETYVHRIGRTGRAGASGIALSFCNGEEQAYLKDIRKLTGQPIPVVEGHPYQASIADMRAPAPSKNNQRRNGQSGNGKSRGRRNGNRKRQWPGN